MKKRLFNFRKYENDHRLHEITNTDCTDCTDFSGQAAILFGLHRFQMAQLISEIKMKSVK